MTRFSSSARKSSQDVGEGRVGGAEAGGEEVLQGAGDLVDNDGGDHGVAVGLGSVWWGDGRTDWLGGQAPAESCPEGPNASGLRLPITLIDLNRVDNAKRSLYGRRP